MLMSALFFCVVVVVLLCCCCFFKARKNVNLLIFRRIHKGRSRVPLKSREWIMSKKERKRKQGK